MKNLDDHLKVTDHEKRKIQIELDKIMKEIEEMNVVRTGKNPTNPRPKGNSKNTRDKRNAAKMTGSRFNNTMADLEFDDQNRIGAKSVLYNNNKSFAGNLSGAGSVPNKSGILNKMSIKEPTERNSMLSNEESFKPGHSSPQTTVHRFNDEEPDNYDIPNVIEDEDKEYGNYGQIDDSILDSRQKRMKQKMQK